MKSLYARLYLSLDAESVPATIVIGNDLISIGYSDTNGRARTLRWHISSLDIFINEEETISRVFHRRSGVEFIADDPTVATLLQDMKAELYKPWYKGRAAKAWRAPMLLLSGMAISAIFLYWVVLPFVADKLSKTISIDTEKTIGEEVYNSMQLKRLEDTAGSKLLTEFFDSMHIKTSYDIRITLIDDNVTNAFALPGGRIVIYTNLLYKTSSYPEIAALLSHEYTHIQNRHATQMIFRKLGSKAILALVLGKVSDLTSVLADNIDDLKSLDYSRALEKEADLEGLEILKKRKIDPKGFVDLFTILKKEEEGTKLPEFLGTHPDLDHRIQYVKKASKGALVEENEDLETIFNELMPSE